jgi:CheY-like chemotaxis protein
MHVKGTTLRIVFSFILLLVVIARHVKDPGARGRFDATFIFLFSFALLFPFIPFDRVKSLTAGGVAISLNEPSVQGAVFSISQDTRIADDLRHRLEANQGDVALMPGARILWIDPHPLTTVGAQRLLRALGADIVMRSSSRDALQELQVDLDFDLVISDVGRHGDSWRALSGEATDSAYEGLNFIRLLRQERCAASELPVIFFSALPVEKVQSHSVDLLTSDHRPEVTDSVEDLIITVVRTTARVRRVPFLVSERKTTTADAGFCFRRSAS